MNYEPLSANDEYLILMRRAEKLQCELEEVELELGKLLRGCCDTTLGPYCVMGAIEALEKAVNNLSTSHLVPRDTLARAIDELAQSEL